MRVDRENRLSHRARAPILAAAPLLAYAKLRTPARLHELNDISALAARAPEVELATRMARFAKDHVADVYVDPQRVVDWLRVAGEAPAEVTKLVRCLNGEGDSPRDENARRV